MRRPKTLAAWLGGPTLLSLMATAAPAQQNVPPPGRPVELPPPATLEEVEATTPAPAATTIPGQVVTPAPAPVPGQVVAPTPAAGPAVEPETVEDQDEQDRQLAESMRERPEGEAVSVPVSIPQGWIRIAIDHDNDGTFDAIETINASDLLQARRMSAERRMGGQPDAMAGGGQPDAMAGEQPDAMTGGSDRGEIRLSGTVQDVQEFRFAGMSGPQRIARLEAEDGVAKVHLGPVEAFGELGIEPGDEITVVGHRGMINDRPVLMAREVTKDDQSVDVDAPEDNRLKRVRGELLGTRTVTFRDRDEEHLVAEVELRSGNVAEVVLGPKARLGDVDLTEGTTLAMLVRPARLNGRLAMAAEQVRIGDQSVTIRDPVEGSVRTEEQLEPDRAEGDVAEDLAEAPDATPTDRDDADAPRDDDQGDARPREDRGSLVPSLGGPTGGGPES